MFKLINRIFVVARCYFTGHFKLVVEEEVDGKIIRHVSCTVCGKKFKE